jgi:hypothetical protein
MNRNFEPSAKYEKISVAGLMRPAHRKHVATFKFKRGFIPRTLKLIAFHPSDGLPNKIYLGIIEQLAHRIAHVRIQPFPPGYAGIFYCEGYCHW